jgi:putative tryptophan/tyrosine transport system substrate-binding protein
VAVHSVADLETAIVDLGSQPGGGFVAMADFFLAEQSRADDCRSGPKPRAGDLPLREVTAAGGLLLYGPDLEDIVRRAAPYVDRILRGENPADLPVQVPTKFQLVVNLETAKALGLTISRDFLLVADEVIE